LTGLKRDVGIALLSAVVGVAVTGAFTTYTIPKAELSVKYTHLASQGVNYINGPNESAPNLTIHRFSWKNSGSKNLKDVVLEFAPNGGDAAYDEGVKQDLFVERPAQSAALSRSGVEVARKGNSVLVRYRRFPVGSTDTVTIVSPGIVDTYELTVSDPDIPLRLDEVSTDYMDPMLQQLIERPLRWTEIILAVAVGSLASFALTFVVFRRKKRG
jgi:hypothetical protein